MLATTLLATVRGYGKIHALVTRGVTRVLEEPVRWRCLQDNRSTQMHYSWAETQRATLVEKGPPKLGGDKRKDPLDGRHFAFPWFSVQALTLWYKAREYTWALQLTVDKPLAIRNKNMVATCCEKDSQIRK